MVDLLKNLRGTNVDPKEVLQNQNNFKSDLTEMKNEIQI